MLVSIAVTHEVRFPEPSTNRWGIIVSNQELGKQGIKDKSERLTV